FLMRLVNESRLVPTKRVNARIAYHDSCYLGRYNGIYDSPRAVLESIPGLELVEAPHSNRSQGLCCGAGGAQVWMEEQNTNRVNQKRTLQLLDTGASAIASACPYCMTMLTDGLKAADKESDVRQMDIAEVLEASIDFGQV